MGFSIESNLIFGWKINTHNFLRFLIKNRVGTCNRKYYVKDLYKIYEHHLSKNLPLFNFNNEIGIDENNSDNENDENNSDNESGIIDNHNEIGIDENDFLKKITHIHLEEIQCCHPGSFKKCWKKIKNIIPKDVYITVCYPDTDGDIDVYVSLINSDKIEIINFEDLLKINKNTIKAAKNFAKMFGAENSKSEHPNLISTFTYYE